MVRQVSGKSGYPQEPWLLSLRSVGSVITWLTNHLLMTYPIAPSSTNASMATKSSKCHDLLTHRSSGWARTSRANCLCINMVSPKTPQSPCFPMSFRGEACDFCFSHGSCRSPKPLPNVPQRFADRALDRIQVPTLMPQPL